MAPASAGSYKPNYIIRKRYPVWGRQCSYLVIVLLLLWKFTQINELTLDPIYVGALCVSIVRDNEPDNPHHMKWLLFDLSQLLYGCMLLFKLTELGLTFNIIVFCLSVTGCYCSLINVMFKPSYLVHNDPTDEYTCTLFEALSFSYINKCLIIPGCKLTSFELDFVPGLIDQDTARVVWNRFQGLFEYGCDESVTNDDNELDLKLEHFASRLNNKKTFGELIYALYKLFKWDIWLSTLYCTISTCLIYITPLAMQRIMYYLSHYEESTGEEEAQAANSGLLLGKLSVNSAIALMVICPIASCKH